MNDNAPGLPADTDAAFALISIARDLLIEIHDHAADPDVVRHRVVEALEHIDDAAVSVNPGSAE